MCDRVTCFGQGTGDRFRPNRASRTGALTRQLSTQLVQYRARRHRRCPSGEGVRAEESHAKELKAGGRMFNALVPFGIPDAGAGVGYLIPTISSEIKAVNAA